MRATGLAILALILAANLPGAAGTTIGTSGPIPADPRIVAIQGAVNGGGVPEASTSEVALSSDGAEAFLLSGDRQRVMEVHLGTGKVTSSIELPGPATGLRLSPDGSLLAVLFGGSSPVLVYRIQEVVLAAILSTPADVRSARFSADGTRLYVACGEGQGLQSYATDTFALVQSVSLPEQAGDLAVFPDGSRLAVACPDGLAIRIVNAQTLQTEGLIPAPPGTSRVACLPRVVGEGVLVVASSALAGAVTIADAPTLTVLKTVSLAGPEGIAGTEVLSDWVLVAREGKKVEVLNRDPLSPSFGERVETFFSGLGKGGFGVSWSVGTLVVTAQNRLSLIVVGPEQLINPLRIQSVVPDSGVSGIQVQITGQFSGADAVQILFMKQEELRASAAATALTPASLEVEVPLEVDPGAVEIWASRSSAAAIGTGTYVAASPRTFESIDSLEGLDGLISELEILAASPGLTAAAHDRLTKAIQSLQRARSAIADDGDYTKALAAMREALDHLRAAGTLGAGVGKLPTKLVQIAQAAVFGRLKAVTVRLGASFPEVVSARVEFERARALLKSGDLSGAMAGFEKAYEKIEKALIFARRLTKSQRMQVLTEAFGDMQKLANGISNRLADDCDPSPAHTGLQDAQQLINGHPIGSLRGTVLEDLCASRLGKSAQKLRGVISGLASTPKVERLQEHAAKSQARLVRHIARLVERNVGANDSLVLSLRKQASLAEGAGSPDAQLASLEGASNLAGPLMSAMDMEPTEPPQCNPKVTIGKLPNLCIFPDKIDPSPMVIPITVAGLPQDEMGVLTVDIRAYDKVTVIYQFAPPDHVTNGTYNYNWDGFGDDGKLLKPRGDAKSGDFYVHAVLTCPENFPESDETLKQFKGALAGKGLIVEPAKVSKCAKEKQQFEAYKCPPGGGGLVRVTEQVLWSVDNKKAGSIDQKGMFTAADVKKDSEDATVTAQDPGTGESGTASVTVIATSGGIVPAAAVVCLDDIVDFDVYKCENGDAKQEDDATYTWKVTPAALGPITSKGLFTARGKGKGKVTAKKGNDTFTAEIEVGEADGMDILEAPTHMCAQSGDKAVFKVQVFCKNNPSNGVKVDFDGRDGATVRPISATTAGAGVAQTEVTAAGRSSAVGSSRLTAKASALKVESALTIMVLDILVNETLINTDDVVCKDGYVTVTIDYRPPGLAYPAVLKPTDLTRVAFLEGAALVQEITVVPGQKVALKGLTTSAARDDVRLTGTVMGKPCGTEDLTVIELEVLVNLTAAENDDYGTVGQSIPVRIQVKPDLPPFGSVVLTSKSPNRVNFGGNDSITLPRVPMTTNADVVIPSLTVRDITLEVALSSDTGSVCGKRDMTAVFFDVRFGVDETTENDPALGGVQIPVNNDFDKGNTSLGNNSGAIRADNQQDGILGHHIIEDDDEVLTPEIIILPRELIGRFRVDYPGRLRLFASRGVIQGSTVLASGAEIPAGPTPHFWVEGDAPSAASGDVQVTFHFMPDGLTVAQSIRDVVLFTVFTYDFINNNNQPKGASAGAVSLFNTHQELPVGAAFGEVTSDQDNFRLEVMNPAQGNQPPLVSIGVGKQGLPGPNLPMTAGPGFAYRSQFFRLVSDNVDDAASGIGVAADPDNQTISVRLGEFVSMYLGGRNFNRFMPVGMPSRLSRNGPNRADHDIRTAFVAFKVFAGQEIGEPYVDTNGNGAHDAGEPFEDVPGGVAGVYEPHLNAVQLNNLFAATIVTLNQRFAQAGIVFVHDEANTVFALPVPAGVNFADGIDTFNGPETVSPPTNISTEMMALIGAGRSAVNRDANATNDILDVYLIPDLRDGRFPFNGRPFAASLFPGLNGFTAPGGNPSANYQNSIFIGAKVPGLTPGQIVWHAMLGHEVMHQVQNAGDSAATFAAGTPYPAGVDNHDVLFPIIPDAAGGLFQPAVNTVDDGRKRMSEAQVRRARNYARLVRD